MEKWSPSQTFLSSIKDFSNLLEIKRTREDLKKYFVGNKNRKKEKWDKRGNVKKRERFDDKKRFVPFA